MKSTTYSRLLSSMHQWARCFAAGVALICFIAGCTHRPTGPVETTAQITGDAASAVVETRDHWKLTGDYYRATGKPLGTVILLHQRGGSGTDWQVLCQILQRSGINAFAIDQRGTGRSASGPGQNGDYAAWDTTPDIEACVTAMLPKGPVGLVGASYGANNALIYAAAHQDQIAGVALFSPGANYHGQDALGAARVYTGPLIIFHEQDDTIAGAGPGQIDKATASRSHKLVVLPGNVHGAAMLNSDVVTATVNFFLKTLK